MTLAALGEFRQRNRALADTLVGKARGGDEQSLGQLSRQTGVEKAALRALLFEDATARLFGFKKNDVVADQALNTRGIGTGGTVAHLSGFRGKAIDTAAAKNVALLLPLAVGKKIDGDPRQLVAGVDAAKIDTSDPPPGAIKLDPSIAAALVKKLIQHIGERLASVGRDDPSYDEKSRTAIHARLAEATTNHQPDRALSDMMTLATAKAPMAAFLDPKTGRGAVGEDTPPLPAAIAKQIDVDAGMKVLAKLNDGQSPIDADTLRDTASSFPLSALKVLEKADVSARLTTRENLFAPTAREREALGERAPTKNDGAGGVFQALYATVGITDGSTREQRCTFLRHELAHAIDAALAPPGMLGLSDAPEFQKIYDDTVLSAKLGGSLQPPTEYAATNPQEMFAEAIAMYTGKHENGGAVLTTRCRGHLKETNRPLYDYVEKLLGTTIPLALAGDKTHGPEQRATAVRQVVQSILDTPPNERSEKQLYTLAKYQTVAGVATKDRMTLEHALYACDQLKQRSNATMGAQADELAARIREHIARL